MTKQQAAAVMDNLITLFTKDQIKFAEDGAKATVILALTMGRVALLEPPPDGEKAQQ